MASEAYNRLIAWAPGNSPFASRDAAGFLGVPEKQAWALINAGHSHKKLFRMGKDLWSAKPIDASRPPKASGRIKIEHTPEGLVIHLSGPLLIPHGSDLVVGQDGVARIVARVEKIGGV